MLCGFLKSMIFHEPLIQISMLFFHDYFILIFFKDVWWFSMTLKPIGISMIFQELWEPLPNGVYIIFTIFHTWSAGPVYIRDAYLSSVCTQALTVLAISSQSTDDKVRHVFFFKNIWIQLMLTSFKIAYEITWILTTLRVHVINHCQQSKYQFRACAQPMRGVVTK